MIERSLNYRRDLFTCITYLTVADLYLIPSAYCKELRADPDSLGWSGGVDLPTGTRTNVSIHHDCQWVLRSTINNGKLVIGVNSNTLLPGSVLGQDTVVLANSSRHHLVSN